MRLIRLVESKELTRENTCRAKVSNYEVDKDLFTDCRLCMPHIQHHAIFNSNTNHQAETVLMGGVVRSPQQSWLQCQFLSSVHVCPKEESCSSTAYMRDHTTLGFPGCFFVEPYLWAGIESLDFHAGQLFPWDEMVWQWNGLDSKLCEFETNMFPSPGLFSFMHLLWRNLRW